MMDLRCFFKKNFLILFMYGLVNTPIFAADPPAIPPFAGDRLPASVEPGRMSQTLAPEIPRPGALPPIKPQEEKATNQLGKEAQRISFRLTKITLQDNHVYSTQTLSTLYRNKLNKLITVAELQGIVQSITNYYRNNGYILTRAILPPQHVKNGEVTIRVIEGFIDQVNVIGKPKGAKCIVLAYGNKIATSQPLELKIMDSYLRLANELPGVQTRAVLEPSKQKTGASDLNLAVDTKSFGGFFSYDDYGTLYIGPQQMTAGGQANSIFQAGDTTSLSYVTTPRPRELKFVDIFHETPLDTNGTRLYLDANNAKTLPGFVLAPLKISGDATNFTGIVRFPVLRSRDKNATLDATFNFLDSETQTFDTTLYYDHVRSLRLGGAIDFSDFLKGTDYINFHISRGLPLFGASTDPNSLFTSRFGAVATYTKFLLLMNRIQPLYKNWSLAFVANGQWSLNPLFASEQFGFGGSQLGRGYDPAEIIGDRGASGSAELRLNANPGLGFLLQSIQYYVYYDIGVIWNIKDLPNLKSKQSASSTGFGARIVFNKYVSGNVMFTQVLTKQIAAESFLGRGRIPRTFFSLTAAI